MLPPTELEPYTPEIGPPTGKARVALWLAIVVALVVIAIVLVIGLR